MTTSTTVTTSAATEHGQWRALRRAALVAILANLAIIMTGAVVRITGSGLGCPDWPTCEGGSVVPTMQSAEWHTYVEFGNRLMTFVVLGAAVWVVLAARRVAGSSAEPRMVVVRRLAWAQVAGVLAQAVLGGITVLTGLAPLVVASHLLASMALLAAAVVLHGIAGRAERGAGGVGARQPGGGDAAVVRGGQRAADRVVIVRRLALLAVAAAGVVLLLGTLVTATGPHSGGDPGTRRLAADIRTMAVAHADAVWFLVAVTLAGLLVARWAGLRRARRAATLLLALELAQGTLGYAQYALGVPPAPVVVHVLGAALVWVAAWRFWLAATPEP